MPKSPLFGLPVVVLGSIDGLTIDCQEAVIVQLPSLITQNPTESGQSIADNIVNLPVRISINGRFTDTPAFSGLQGAVGFAGGGAASAANVLGLDKATKVLSAAGTVANAAASFVDGTIMPGRAKKMFNKLRELRDKRQPFDVVIDVDTFRNMAFESLTQTATKDDGRTIRFTAEMVTLVIVNTLGINPNDVAPAVSHSVAKVQDLGVVATQ